MDRQPDQNHFPQHLASQVRYEIRAVDEARPDALLQSPFLWTSTVQLDALWFNVT